MGLNKKHVPKYVADLEFAVRIALGYLEAANQSKIVLAETVAIRELLRETLAASAKARGES